jgi:hypothetical protein
MHREKYEEYLFLIAFIVASIYVVSIFGINASKTGFAFQVSNPDKESVYNFIKIVKSQPDNYIVVIGKFAKDYEISYAARIAKFLGARLSYESEIRSYNNLVLIGNPATNMVLDKTLLQPYDANGILFTVSKSNLMIVLSSEEQSKMALDIIQQYENNKEKLSPASAMFGASDFFGPFIAIIIGMLLIFGILMEKYRHANVRRAQEAEREYKLVALESYISKYSQLGYPLDAIRKGLIKYGYNEETVDTALQGVV